MIEISFSHFRYITTNTDIADSFVKFIEAMGIEVKTEILQCTCNIDYLLKV
jgi:hypothetical protein